MRWTLPTITVLGALLAIPAPGSVTVTLELVHPFNEVEQPPDFVLVVDVVVDVSPDDVWTAAGMRVTPSWINPTILYATDPNTGEPAILNPGTADRFVTCISRPRPRFGNARYNNALASWAGRYCPTGPSYTATPQEFNVAWFASPPMNSSSPSVDGAIARVAFQLPSWPGWCYPGICCRGGVFPGTTPPVGLWPIAYFECMDDHAGVVSASYDEPATVGQDWVLAFDPGNGGTCPWDINQDADGPDMEDLAALLATFGLCSGDPGFNWRANFAGGLCIDVEDLARFLTHFGEECCLN